MANATIQLSSFIDVLKIDLRQNAQLICDENTKMKPELTDLIPSTEPPLPMAAEAEKTVLSTSDESVIQNPTASEDIEQWKPDRRLWAIVGSLAFLNMVGGLENTITVVALPTIVADIKGGSNYVWISDIQFITG